MKCLWCGDDLWDIEMELPDFSGLCFRCLAMPGSTWEKLEIISKRGGAHVDHTDQKVTNEAKST